MTPDDSAYPTSASDAERYAVGQMTWSEELNFETRILEDPDLAAELDTIYRMREGFRLLYRRGQLAALVRGRGFVGARYALAAAVVLCAVGLAFLLSFRAMRPVIPPVLVSSLAELGGTAVAAGKVLLVHARADERPTEIAGVTNARALAILPAIPADSPTYRATLERLSDRGATALASNVEARSDRSGYVSLYLDARRLMPGVYRLTLSQLSGSEQFQLTVTAAH